LLQQRIRLLKGKFILRTAEVLVRLIEQALQGRMEHRRVVSAYWGGSLRPYQSSTE
jgi:hypothetical protein